MLNRNFCKMLVKMADCSYGRIVVFFFISANYTFRDNILLCFCLESLEQFNLTALARVRVKASFLRSSYMKHSMQRYLLFQRRNIAAICCTVSHISTKRNRLHFFSTFS